MKLHSVATLALLIQQCMSDNRRKKFESGLHEDSGLHCISSMETCQLIICFPIGLCDTTVKQRFGHIDIGEDKNLFFWLFESRANPSVDPLILWLNGGPGASSMTGVFMGVGPCKVVEGGARAEFSETSWTNNANVLFLDQPVNVGFSYTDSPDVSITTTDEAADDVLLFLEAFMRIYPQYRGLSLFLAGQSYAGHYIPAISKRIIDSNTLKSDRTRLNLKGISIGNGLIDELLQFEYYSVMAADKKYGPLFPSADIVSMKKDLFPKCRNAIEVARAIRDYSTIESCTMLFMAIFETDLNYYDVRKPCDYSSESCYPVLLDIEEWANWPETQQALRLNRYFKPLQRSVYAAMKDDWVVPYDGDIAYTLDKGVAVLIYAGDADWSCNWHGLKALAKNLDWSGKSGFETARDYKWESTETKKTAGEYKEYKNLAFVKVLDAGHLVTYDQPIHALELIQSFLRKYK